MSARRPPFNQEAEECVLGAMLLTNDAIEVGLDMLSPSDFYVPKHGFVFAAIEQTYAAGHGVDPSTVAETLRRADKLDTIGGRPYLLELQGGTPASANARSYAMTVAELSGCRRAIEYGAALAEAGYSSDIPALDLLLTEQTQRVVGHLADIMPPPPPIDAWDLAAMEYPVSWQIEGVLKRHERVMISGGEGGGKSLLLRQLSVQVACGVHPFTLDEIDPVRVLHIDLQESEEQAGDEYRMIFDVARDRYRRGNLLWTPRRKGLDIRRRADFRWLDQAVGRSKPGILVIGPLYKTFKGDTKKDKHSEEVAEEVAAAFDRLMVEHGITLLIEAHSPHGTDGNRAGWRPYGAALWLRWPEFGFGMRPLNAKDTERMCPGQRGIELVKWRGNRDRRRVWPRHLIEATDEQRSQGRWPWECLPEEVY